MSLLSTIKLTAEQYLMLGEDPPSVRLELVDGKIAVHPGQTPDHSRIIVQLAMILGTCVSANNFGELFMRADTILDPFNVRRPDLLFFANDRLDFIGEKAMEGPPTLAVEVVSADSAQDDRVQKFAQYRKAGVKHYWIIDPALRTLEAFDLKGRRYLPTGSWQGHEIAKANPFPKLEIPLSDLWRPRRRSRRS